MTIDNIKNTLTKYTKKVLQEENYGFVISKERDIDAMVDFDTTKKIIRCYPAEEIPNQTNTTCSLCDVDIAINRIFNPLTPNEQDGRAFNVPQPFLEKIWLQCQNKDEVNFFIDNILTQNIIFSTLEKLDQLNTDSYKNFLISIYFNKNKKSSTDKTLALLTNFVKSRDLTLSSENLERLINHQKNNLNQINNQALLKDFIEKYMPQEITKFKACWKKIDLDLVANEEFLIEQPCYSIGFNKVQIYALAPTENTDFFQRRLQNLCTFLNKPATKKIIPLERIVFDGEQEAQTHYRFIIFSPNKPTLKFKQFLNDLVLYNIEFNKVPDMDDLRKVINYMLLQEKAQIGVESKIERKRKI